MPKLAVFLVLALVGCGLSNPAAPRPGVAVAEVQGWRFPTGKRPTRAEYAAIAATCRDGAVRASRGKGLDACFADLGLRRE